LNEGENYKKKECKHEWKAIEETHHGAYVKLECVKCGKTKEIELFP